MEEKSLSYNRIFIREYKKDYKLSFIICWMMISLFIINSSYLLETVTGIPSQMVSNIAKGILFLCIIYNVGNIFRRLTNSLILFCIIGAIVLLLNYLLIYNKFFFMEIAETFVINIFPIFVIIMCIKDSEILLDLLIKTSRYLVAFSVFVVILSLQIDNTYSMGFANSLTLPVILTLFDYYKTKKLYKFGLFFVGCFSIIVLGSRGALLGIAFYAIVLLCKGLKSKKNRFKTGLLIILIICGFIFYEELINLSICILDKMNIYSRTLYLLLNEQTHDSGRNIIYGAIINEIKHNPFQIRGIAGEYIITNGAYAHNFILELLCDFGVVVGGISIIWIFWHIIQTIFNNFIEKESEVSMIFMATSIPVMFVSGSIWTTTYFWLWIALVIKRNKHKYRRYYE